MVIISGVPIFRIFTVVLPIICISLQVSHQVLILLRKSLHPVHTCDIFLEPDREIWDFSEGDWGLR